MTPRVLLRTCWPNRRHAVWAAASHMQPSRSLHALPQSVAPVTRGCSLQPVTKRWHSGHGHSHGVLGLDEPEEDAEARALRLRLSAADVAAADRITWLGVALNVALSGLKGAAGVACHSSGLLADAVHSLSDLVSDGVTLVALKYCARPADGQQPYGYGKYETMGALSVSLLLVGGSLGIVVHSLDSLLVLLEPATAVAVQPAELAKLVDHVDVDTLEAVQTLAEASAQESIRVHPAALGIAALSVAAKEALFRSTLAIGRRVQSSVLVANAWHHRSDAVTSVVATAGIGLSLAGFPLFDPLAGMAVGGIILKMGGEIGWAATKELCDAQLPDTIVRSLWTAVDTVVTRSGGELRAVRRLRSRKVGRHVHVDLTLVLGVDADGQPLTAHRACEWQQQVKNAIQREVPRVQDVLIEIVEDHEHEHEHEHDNDHDHDHDNDLDHGHEQKHERAVE